MEFFDTLARLFHSGGPFVMSSIFLVFVLSVVIIIERSYRYWLVFDVSNSEAFLSAVQKMIMSNSIENAIRLCKKAEPKLLPYILAEGLKRANDSTEEVELAMEHATLEKVPEVNKRINLLGTLANLATLLGLLGTIFGLMRSFAAAANATGAQKQSILAEGISEALTATSFGLSTALLCILAHGILSSKQLTIISNINHSVARLMDLLFTRSVRLNSAKDPKKPVA